jgi:hypothetical protein
MPPVGAETPVKHAGSKGHSHASPEEKGGSKGNIHARMVKKKQKRGARAQIVTGQPRTPGGNGFAVKRPRDGGPSLGTETLERFKHKWIWHARKMLAAEKQTGRPARGGDKPKGELEAGHSDAEDDDPGGCGESDGGGQHGGAHLCHGGGLPGAPADAGGSCCGHAGGHHHAFGCDEGEGQWSDDEGQGGDGGDDDDDGGHDGDDDDDDDDGCEQGSEDDGGSELSAGEDSEGSEPLSADEGEAAGGSRALEAPLGVLEEAQREYKGRAVGRAMPTNAGPRFGIPVRRDGPKCNNLLWDLLHTHPHPAQPRYAWRIHPSSCL